MTKPFDSRSVGPVSVAWRLALCGMSLLVAGAGVASGQSADLGLMVPAESRPPGPREAVRPIEAHRFCTRVATEFARLAVRSGLNQLGTEMVAASAPGLLVAGLRSGAVTDYLNVDALLAVAPGGSQERPEAGADQRDGQYLATATMVAAGLGLAGPMTFLKDMDDLRLLPRMPPGAAVAVVVREPGRLNAGQLRQVVAAARGAGRTLHVVWVPAEPQASTPDRLGGGDYLVAAAVTGGTLVDLSGTADPCQRRL